MYALVFNFQDHLLNCVVFLRALEYYEGIMFLTTNRISDFDPAFISRVHVALKYNRLDSQAKRDLGRNFIQRASTDIAQEAWVDSMLNDLAKVNLNGRQIKTTVQTALALAKSSDERLSRDHFDVVLANLRDFEAVMYE